MQLNLDRATLWQVMLLVTVLSVLLTTLTLGPALVMPLGTDGIVVSPMGYGVILGAGLVMLVFALHFTGTALGGQGTFAEALAVVAWLEVLSLVFRVAQVLIGLISLPVAGLLSIAATVFLLWCLVRFTQVLHRFDGVGKAVLTLFVALLGISLGVTLILTLIGVGSFQGVGDA